MTNTEIVKAQAASLKRKVGDTLSQKECEDFVITTITEMVKNREDIKYRFISRDEFGELKRLAFYEKSIHHQSNINWNNRNEYSYFIEKI